MLTFWPFMTLECLQSILVKVKKLYDLWGQNPKHFSNYFDNCWTLSTSRKIYYHMFKDFHTFPIHFHDSNTYVMYTNYVRVYGFRNPWHMSNIHSMYYCMFMYKTFLFKITNIYIHVTQIYKYIQSKIYTRKRACMCVSKSKCH